MLTPTANASAKEPAALAVTSVYSAARAGSLKTPAAADSAGPAMLHRASRTPNGVKVGLLAAGDVGKDANVVFGWPPSAVAAWVGTAAQHVPLPRPYWANTGATATIASTKAIHSLIGDFMLGFSFSFGALLYRRPRRWPPPLPPPVPGVCSGPEPSLRPMRLPF
jgi:hypothetical protein